MNNKIFSAKELINKGIKITESGPAILDALDIQNPDTAIIINDGRFITVITKNGQKIIYDTSRTPFFTQELLEIIIAEGDSPEKVDQLVDTYAKCDTFGMVIDETGKPWSKEQYPNTIIDSSKKIKKFNEYHANRRSKKFDIAR